MPASRAETQRQPELSRKANAMKLTIFGATGATGTSLTGQALAAGHEVTAIDRNLPHGFNVSRADLAASILALLDDPATVHRHISIAN